MNFIRLNRFNLIHFGLAVFLICSSSIAISKAFATEKDSVEIILIPEGKFLMGSKSGEGRVDERPQREVYLDQFSIDIEEVTNKRYLFFIHSTGRKEPPNPYGDNLLSQQGEVASMPVVQVTWYDAVDYCRWAGKRLPTEAEWEKAARGENGFVYPWGSESPRTRPVNFEKEWAGTKTLLPVRSTSGTSSPYGVHDLSGNAREWVRDWYGSDYFKTASPTNPQGPDSGILKVIKGGSWHSFKGDVRAASRGKGGFALKTDGIGFRCAK